MSRLDRRPLDSSVASGQRSVLVCLPGSVNDKSWSEAAARGAEAALHDRVEYAIVESLAPDFGNWSVVLGHGIAYEKLLSRAASEFPDKTFVVSDDPGLGNRSEQANISYVDWRWGQATYLGGVLAARLSKSARVGFIAGAPVPTQRRTFSGFVAGAEATNQDIEVLGTCAGTFEDRGSGKRLAAALLNEGVDVIAHTADITGAGAIDAVEEADKIGIGFLNNGERERRVVAGFIESDIGNAIQHILTTVLSEAETPAVFEFGLGSGFLRFSPNPSLVPAEVISEIESLENLIAASDSSPGSHAHQGQAISTGHDPRILKEQQA